MSQTLFLPPAVWGHRGAMAEAPQNTLPSFQRAVDQGADGVELDVQLTKDGVPVVYHDHRLETLTDGRGLVSQYTWKDLRALDAGSHFGRSWAGTPIPSLEEVLGVLGSLTVNVELKTAFSEAPQSVALRTLLQGPRPYQPDPLELEADEVRRLVEAVLPLVGRVPPGRLWLSSFDPTVLSWCRRLDPGLRLGWLRSPSLPRDASAFVDGLSPEAWHPHASMVNPDSVAEARSRGRRIHLWTAEPGPQAQRLASFGVDAMISNRPGALRAQLHDRSRL